MTTSIARTPQEYVDAEIARHEAALATAPIVEGLLTHGRAIAELRRMRRRQYRPRLFVPEHLRAGLDELLAEANAMVVVDDPGPTFVDRQAPQTSPIYALTARSLGLDPSRR